MTITADDFKTWLNREDFPTEAVNPRLAKDSISNWEPHYSCVYVAEQAEGDGYEIEPGGHPRCIAGQFLHDMDPVRFPDWILAAHDGAAASSLLDSSEAGLMNLLDSAQSQADQGHAWGSVRGHLLSRWNTYASNKEPL